MSDPSNGDQRVFKLTRRKALKGLAVGLGALAMPSRAAAGSAWDAFFQKHFSELGRRICSGS